MHAVRSGNDLFERRMLVVGGVELQIKFTPRILFCDVTAAKIEAVGGGTAEVLKRGIDDLDLAGTVSDNCASRGE